MPADRNADACRRHLAGRPPVAIIATIHMPTPLHPLRLWLVILLALATQAAGATPTTTPTPEPLIDMAKLDPSKLTLARGQAELDRSADAPILRLTAADAGGSMAVTFQAPGGTWDLSAREAISIHLRNPADKEVTVTAIARNPGADRAQDTCRGSLVLPPHEAGVLNVGLMRRPDDPGFARFEPFFKSIKSIAVRENTLDPARVQSLELSLREPDKQQSIEIRQIDVTGQRDPASVPFFPFIDRFGQYRHTDWPGKIHTDGDFFRGTSGRGARSGPLDRPRRLG